MVLSFFLFLYYVDPLPLSSFHHFLLLQVLEGVHLLPYLGKFEVLIAINWVDEESLYFSYYFSVIVDTFFQKLQNH